MSLWCVQYTHTHIVMIVNATVVEIVSGNKSSVVHHTRNATIVRNRTSTTSTAVGSSNANTNIASTITTYCVRGFWPLTLSEPDADILSPIGSSHIRLFYGKTWYMPDKYDDSLHGGRCPASTNIWTDRVSLRTAIPPSLKPPSMPPPWSASLITLDNSIKESIMDPSIDWSKEVIEVIETTTAPPSPTPSAPASVLLWVGIAVGGLCFLGMVYCVLRRMCCAGNMSDTSYNQVPAKNGREKVPLLRMQAITLPRNF